MRSAAWEMIIAASFRVAYGSDQSALIAQALHLQAGSGAPIARVLALTYNYPAVVIGIIDSTLNHDLPVLVHAVRRFLAADGQMKG